MSLLKWRRIGGDNMVENVEVSIFSRKRNEVVTKPIDISEGVSVDKTLTKKEKELVRRNLD